MKKLYLLLTLLFFSIQHIGAQTTENFESQTAGSASFTNGAKMFNLTSSYLSFTVVNFPASGYNGSNKFIQVEDSAGPEALGQTGTISDGTGSFKVNSLWIFVSGTASFQAGATSNGAAGSITFRGKLAGVTQFTVVKNTTGNDIGTVLPNNGFIPINFATEGGADNTSFVIDQLEIQLSTNYDYFAIDDFIFRNGAVAPTVTTTTATNTGAVKATMGGNVTADGGDATIERGIVWATTANPTIANNKFQIGTGIGTYSGVVSSLPPSTLIHYRAYAKNSGGTGYGSDLTFTTNAALSATTSQTNLSCNGGSNGTASVTASGGVTSYSYSWSPSGGTGATATGLAAGAYICTITDNESTQITKNITITQPTAITATTSQTNVSCNGGSNGSASVTASGGTPGYTYSWSPSGGTAATASGLAASATPYVCTITDANSCSITKSFTITQPTAITATTSQNNVSCNGGSNGSASVTASGGTPGYTYSWSPSGGTAATASGLAASATPYVCTITDANSCTITKSFTITQPTAITATTSQTNVSCNGGSNGSASVTASGGTPGYTYSWSPSGGTTATASGLVASATPYVCTITDANSCSITKSFTITQPTAITATTSQTNVSCNGGSNGSASVTASGGTPGYTYSWSPSGGTTATASGLVASATPYVCTITDANSCSITKSFTITQPIAITATTSQTNVSCNGGSNGSASVTASGGTPGYTYSWSPSGGTAATASGLAASATPYVCTITDANSCSITKSFTITQPTAITATTSQTNVSCNGGSNGSASVTASGGTPGYTYSWSPSGGTTATASGLAASATPYVCTITDANSCSITKSFTITQPTAITATTSQTNVSCNGGSNGSASVTASGGTPGYTYSWSPSGGTGATASGLSPGAYNCTITDANNCQITKNFTITQPTAITATTSQTNVSCNGGSNGSASVTASGGTPGYTYSWSPSGGTAATASGLAASATPYVCTITDANSCSITKSFTINQPIAITATTSQTNVSCNSGSNGSASVTAAGGAGGYTYSWSPSGGTAATASGLAASATPYVCTITDANSCSITKSFTITQPTAITATTSQTNVSCNGGTNGSASVTASGGTPGYTYSWSPSGGTGATASGLAASATPYVCTITDANSCSITKSFTITQPTAITATTSQTNLACNGGSNGSASVTAAGGSGGYTYSWSPSGGTGATASGLAASATPYVCTITDANSCSITKSFTITQPTAITATTSQTNLACNGGSNGSASVTAAGGSGGYTYSWSPSGGTAATANGLAAGAYTCTITDANNCQITKNFTITQPTAINFTTTVLSGYDYNTGYSQTIVASGGTGSKTYAVTAGSLPSGFSLSTAGQIIGTSTQIADSNFTVTATDDNSCTASYNYVLKLNQIPITVTAIPSQTKIYGQSDSVLTYTVTPSLLPGDSFSGNLTRAVGENIGVYAINQGSLSAGSKYLITYVGSTFSITAKPITVTADASQNKIYGTTDPVLTYSVSPSLISGDTFTGALTRAAGNNVGTYAIGQGNLSAGSNYTITYVSKDFSITAKPIAVTADASQKKVYGTTDPIFTYSVSPSLVSGDTFTGALTRAAGNNVGTYAIGQGNLSAGSNYTITYVSKDFSITAKPITVTADASQKKVYGTTDPIFTYSVSPSLVSGDLFTGVLTRTAGNNVGTYAIGQGSLSAGSNYTITYVSKDFSITAKPITVTADASQKKVYGTPDPVLTYSVSPSLISGDSFVGALTRATGENVGTYAITQGTLSIGSNYTITYIGTVFTIIKADQIISWNQALGSGCDGTNTIILTAVSSSGLPISYVSSNTNTVTVSNSSLIFQNYGSATITASQLGNNNYNPAPSVVLPTVNSQPNLIKKHFDNIIFFDNSSKNFKAYSWYKNGVLVPSQTTQYFKDTEPLNGTYYAIATKLDGTLITTCPLTFSSTVQEEYIKIAPNPTKINSDYQLITNISASKLQNSHIEVFSIIGVLVDNKINNENTVTLKAPSAEGIYIVRLTLTNGKTFTKNLLVKD